jgi:hypothetical protein
MAGCSGALSVKPFERSRSRLRRTRALWRFNGAKSRFGGASRVCGGARLTTWGEESSWERPVCGGGMSVKSEKQGFVGREDAEGL